MSQGKKTKALSKNSYVILAGGHADDDRYRD